MADLVHFSLKGDHREQGCAFNIASFAQLVRA